MGRWGLRIFVGAFALVAVAALSSCTRVDLARLAGDDTAGRNNNTAGSTLARQYLIDQLKPIAQGLNTAATGDAAYTQAIDTCTNVVAVIRGSVEPNKYVVVGAHYDHLGSSCTQKSSGDTICNGATDNATGVSAALEIARSIGAQKTKPRRSVIFAFWDREEDGLLGSLYYVNHPLVPLADTVGYVNFDIQGSDLSPSLRDTSFAVASESGGTQFQQIVRDAIAGAGLHTELLSSIFGQNRSDYVSFLGKQIPSVFFTDATGPCYHTTDDEIGIVDFGKLQKQLETAGAVTRALANASSPPAFVPGQPLATFADAQALQRTLELLWNDRDRFSAADQATLDDARSDLATIVNDGEANFGSDDVSTILSDAANVVLNILPKGPCDGFRAPAAAQDARTVAGFALKR
jgi:hypothetical protein